MNERMNRKMELLNSRLARAISQYSVAHAVSFSLEENEPITHYAYYKLLEAYKIIKLCRISLDRELKNRNKTF